MAHNRGCLSAVTSAAGTGGAPAETGKQCSAGAAASEDMVGVGPAVVPPVPNPLEAAPPAKAFRVAGNPVGPTGRPAGGRSSPHCQSDGFVGI